ncbi:MAG: sigma-70 family RNA polymerase sigma factor [Clostridia bacterium]|nr:sigma-70 family RNA polymerase sigma factor [Clostridia bacterium]
MKNATMGNRMQNDETLVMLTLAGDQDAYEVLVRRYEQAVRSAALSVTHREFLAEDAAQDAFITAWIKLNYLREPSKFGAWICRIAKNCARNTVMRMRPYMSMDDPDFPEMADEATPDPAAEYTQREDERELHDSVDRLPTRVRLIIRLHYFEGLSVIEIAERLGISQGTVKWQLQDGRKRIRKDLCAMNEAWNDTLVQKVMKKVAELKLWESKNNKDGFETVYRDVLGEVEQLPESREKQHAKADVLMRGWWWIPGEQNDELLALIREAAQAGKNDEVMRFIVLREDEKLWGDARLAYIRDKQIPYLKENGFVLALASEYFSLGRAYFDRGDEGDLEKAKECYETVLRTVPASDEYHTYAKMEIESEALAKSKAYTALPESSYRTFAIIETYRREAAETLPIRTKGYHYGIGGLESYTYGSGKLLATASHHDGHFTLTNTGIGETHYASDGETSLTLLSHSETVSTPAGTFEGCEVWQSEYSAVIYTTYYKEGVGIIRQTVLDAEASESWVLCEYKTEGNGLLPLVLGNTWLYRMEDSNVFDAWTRYECTYADGTTAIVGGVESIIRHGYDKERWSDMVQQISNEYFCEVDGKHRVCDVTPAIARAEALAQTPLQKAYTRAAGAVARRIMAADPEFNPDHTATGHWNFFEFERIRRHDGMLTLSGYNSRWSFELKCMGVCGDASEPLLFNDIYGILQDAAQHLWSEEWTTQGTHQIEFLLWGRHAVRTTIETVRECEPVTVKAGTFDDCITLKLNIDGPKEGWSYRGGAKEYTLARGVGIIRTVNDYAQETKKAIYELVSYYGTGEGYMPIEDGMTRRFEAQGLTDGFVGYADYAFTMSESGMLYIIADRCGIRNLPPPITDYESILGEQIEDQLWDDKKHAESRLQNDVNNFNLLLHYLFRNHRGLGEPHRTSAWHKHRCRMLESLTMDGSVPPALQGFYAYFHFAAACATFGRGKDYFDEGYALLERAFELFDQWVTIPDGEALSIGDGSFSADIKMIKGKNLLVLPDGSRVTCEDVIYSAWNDGSIMYRGMTAAHGWEWFNGVRNEEKFKAYIERARKFVEKK